MFKRIIPLFLIAAYCYSCRTYQPTARAWWRVQEAYNAEDTLYVKDFVLCYSRKEPDDEIFDYFPRKRMSAINEDSVFTVFESALRKLELPLSIIASSENRCDASFHRQHPQRLWKVNSRRVKEIANLGEKKTVLLPFLRIDQYWRISVRGHPAVSSNLVKTSWLNIMIFVVRDQEIIYRKQYRFSQNDVFEEFKGMNVSYPYPEIEQIHWDNLVRLAMEDYMERMK